MRKILPFFMLVYLLTAGLVFTADNDTVVPDQPQENDPMEEILYQKASHLFDEEDYGKALILYNRLIADYPDSPLVTEAAHQMESIINDLMSEISPEAKYNKINDSFSLKKTLSLYENAVYLLSSHPSKKFFKLILKFLDQCLWEPAIRFDMSFVGKSDMSLVYNGSTLNDGVRIHEFSYGSKKVNAKLGDSVLFYKLTAYDDILDQVELTPLDELPYNLLEKNDRQSFHYLEAKVTHIHLEHSIPVHIFIDQLVTDRGLPFCGLARYDADNNLTLDFPFINIKRITLSESKVESLNEMYIKKNPCVFDKKQSSSFFSDPLAVSRARIQYYVNTKHWFEAVGLYFLLYTKNQIPQDDTRFNDLYNILEKKHMSTTLAERMMEKAVYFISHGYFFSGFNQFYALSKKFASEPLGLDARTQLIKNAHKPDGVFVVESINSVPFPLTFMGYNKVDASAEQYQLNYKGRSHFVGQDQLLGGYRMLKSEEKTTEIFNPTLNIKEKLFLKYLVVQQEKVNTFVLKSGESLCNKRKVYIEMEDRRTGKVYPGYLILDYVKTIKDEEYYGIIADTSKKHELQVFQSLTDLESTVAIKEFNTTELERLSAFEPLAVSHVSPIIGKVLFSRLKNLFCN